MMLQAEKVRVFVAADVDPVAIALISGDPRFSLEFTPAYSEDDLARRIGDAQVLVTRYHNQVTRRVLEHAPALKAIVQGTSGLDNIDLAFAAERGIEVIGIPGENANAVAELVISHMIALTRTVPSYDRMIRAGEWQRADCATRRELRGYRIGIVGLGRVGGRVAKLATAFGCDPAAYDPYVTDDDFRERHARRVTTLDGIVATSDILTMHVPLTNETRGMIGARELAMLPRGAFVLNTCRGPVVDLDALFASIDSDQVGGAALDVYDPEPPKRVWPDDPRVILTPHIAGCTKEAKESIGRATYRKICEFFQFDGQSWIAQADN